MSNLFSLKKINNETIDVIPAPHYNEQNILGYNIIPMLYANIFICARKGSGKTNVINKILQSCIDSNTSIIVFAATHNSDSNWIYIKKWLEKKQIPSMFFLNIVEDGHNNLDEIIKFMQAQDEAEQERLKEEKENKNRKTDDNLVQIIKFDNLGDDTYSLKIKVKKPKKIAPKYMLIFDDMSADLKNKNVAVLLKNLRHFKSKVIISSQYPNDIDKAARVQIDFWALFKGFEPLKMEEIFLQLDLTNINFETFYQLYKQITSEPHQLLYIDKGNNEIRKNFNYKVEIKRT